MSQTPLETLFANLTQAGEALRQYASDADTRNAGQPPADYVPRADLDQANREKGDLETRLRQAGIDQAALESRAANAEAEVQRLRQAGEDAETDIISRLQGNGVGEN